MIRKFLALILCGIMLFCLVACSENNTPVNTQSTESKSHEEITSSPEETKKPTNSVFNTENITQITFYAYYGEGKGSKVPSEHMEEIINWLGSFTIDKEVGDEYLLLAGVNTIFVEIEYADGTVIKKGMDSIIVDGTTYYMKSDEQPECFNEIISKTSLK